MLAFVLAFPRAADPLPVTVPFEWLKAGTPIVAVTATINGHAGCRLSLDTGNAYPLALSKSLAEQLKLPLKEMAEPQSVKAVGNGKPVKLWDTDPISLTLGAGTFTEVQTNVSDYVDNLAKTLKVQWDGNIGYGFLKDYTIAIDYPHKTLGFSHDAVPDGVAFHLGKRPLIVVETKVNGQGPYHFVLDTGAVRCVVSPAIATRLSLKMAGSAKMIGGAGMADAQLASGVTLDVGKRSVSDLLVTVADFVDVMSKYMGEQIDGIVGVNFFGTGKLTVDYPNHVLRFD